MGLSMSDRFKTPLAVFVIAVLTACMGSKGNIEEAQMDDKEKEAVSALSWLESADAAQNALAAVAKKQFMLYSDGGRGGALPGIPAEQVDQLRELCGTTVLPGATDVVHGDVHLSYLQKAYAYADAYNRIVAQHCVGN